MVGILLAIRMGMNKEEIEQGMKCCNEFLCGECPYEKYDDKVSHQYTMRCIHMLMQDINKLYFDENRSAIEKQIPKKIIHPGGYDNYGIWHTWNGIDGVPYDLCPSCGTNLCTDGVFGRDKNRIKYCENCGQKLDWT